MPRLPSTQTYNDLNGEEARDILLDWCRQLLSSQPQLQRHLTLPMARMRLSLHLDVDMFIGGTIPVDSPPEQLTIDGSFELGNMAAVASIPLSSIKGIALNRDSLLGNISFDPATMERRGDYVFWKTDLSATVNAAPIPGGSVPDAVRAQHNLPISRPGYGPRDIGSHLFLSDIAEETEIRRAAAIPSPIPDPGPIPTPVDSTGGRQGIVADGYVFSSEPVNPNITGDAVHQVIPVDNGAIEVDMRGRDVNHAGITIPQVMRRASVKTQGDQKGALRGSVSGVYDAGPAGLMTGGINRTKLEFGNKH